MGVIFDSCIWVGLATGEIGRDRVIATTGDLPVFVSAISLGELAFGVEACNSWHRMKVGAGETAPHSPVGKACRQT